MIEKLSNSRNSQQQSDVRMRIVFISLSVILIMMFLTPFYLLATDPKAPQLTYQSFESNNFRVSGNRDYITADWNFTFRINNNDDVYSFLYGYINADMVDEDRNLIVARDEHPSFSQVPNTETNIVFKFRNAFISIAEWSEDDLRQGSEASGKAKVTISMRWKLSINGGYMPRSRYTRLNIICQGNVIEFSSQKNHSENYTVQFHYPGEEDGCTAHLDRMSF